MSRRTTESPILDGKDPTAESVFKPEALLREARRQKELAGVPVPEVCVLDPDGDLVRHLRGTGEATCFENWACYHTQMDLASLAGRPVGLIGCAVGAPFAVLIAEQLFASGCKLLVSLTSAGQILAAGTPPYFVVIDRALRDEGTSYHYAPAQAFATADPTLVTRASLALRQAGLPAVTGASWTTDAPFRETAPAIDAARARGILAVEMEAAALYSFAQAQGKTLLCLAHVTNTMGQTGVDFEKGEADGTDDARAVLTTVIEALDGTSTS